MVRLRDQMVGKRRRVKQQIKSFLLQYGIAEPEGLKDWSVSSRAELGALELVPELRFCLDELLAELAFLDERMRLMDRQLRLKLKQSQYVHTAKILRSHPGVGPITSQHVCLELFVPERFRSSAEVAKYVGLCPKVSQSGEKRREGKLLKTGRRQFKAVLVEAAWSWYRKDPAAKRLYARLVANTGQSNKAIAALARHLIIHLWRMMCNREMYRPAAA